MKINVKVKPNAKQESVEKTGEKDFLLRVKAPAREGRANQAVVELLSEYFNLPKSGISIVRGEKSKNKVVNLCE
ncbi:MAG: DUF167 domain-containing protein [Candidatus Omnitrophota bacterium]|jgi:hypothetical protein